jgi:hypothetical protein
MSRLLSQTALYAVLCLLVAPVILPGATSIRLSQDRPTSAFVINQMQRELHRIAKPSGQRFEWVQDGGALPGRRVSIRLLGSCTGDLRVNATRGPMGWTKIVDGRILPYVEIDCNRVRATILPDVERMETVFREAALGRALARVLAHELRHAMARTLTHEDHGLAQASLSARDLLFGSYHLDSHDLAPLAAVNNAATAPMGSSTSDPVADPGPAADAPLDTGR